MEIRSKERVFIGKSGRGRGLKKVASQQLQPEFKTAIFKIFCGATAEKRRSGDLKRYK